MFAFVYGITCIRVKPKVLQAQNLVNHSYWDYESAGYSRLYKNKQTIVGFNIFFFIFSTMRLRAQEESESKNVSVYVTPLPFSASCIAENVTC